MDEQVVEPATRRVLLIGRWIPRRRGGLRVDGASEVLRFSGAEIELPNAAAQRGPRRSVRGIAKLSERLILLLDLDQILGESSSWLSSSSAGERKGAG